MGGCVSLGGGCGWPGDGCGLLGRRGECDALRVAGNGSKAVGGWLRGSLKAAGGEVSGGYGWLVSG